MQACHYLISNRKTGYVREHMKSTIGIRQYSHILFIEGSNSYKSYTLCPIEEARQTLIWEKSCLFYTLE